MKAALLRIETMKKVTVEGKKTLSKQQKTKDTSSDLANTILSFENILSQIENAKMATQASIEDNKLKAQLFMYDSTLNQNRILTSMKQQLQLLLAKQEMELKDAVASMKGNKIA